MSSQSTRTKWGRAKFGDGRVSAMAIAIPCGLILGAVLGLLAVGFGVTGSNPALGGAVFALCLALPVTALVYVLVVDRTTLEGVTERPDDSVESNWYQSAAAGALTDLVLLAGVGGLILAFVPGDIAVDPQLLLVGVVVVAAASVATRYLLLRRRG